MADRWGRRLPLMINVILYAVLSVLSGLAPSYGIFIFLADAVRHRHGRRVGRRRVARARVGVAEMARPAVGPAAGGLRHRQHPGRAGLPAGLSVFPRALGRRWLARAVLHRRPPGAAVDLHPLEGEGAGSLARAPHGLDDVSAVDFSALAPVSLSRPVDDDAELHVARHAGHVSDAAEKHRLHAAADRRHDGAVRNRRGAWRPGLRALLGPGRPPPRDDDRHDLLSARRAVLGLGAQHHDRRRRVPDAVLRAGRVGRGSRAHQRAVAGPAPRILSGLCLSAWGSCARPAFRTSSRCSARGLPIRRRWAA